MDDAHHHCSVPKCRILAAALVQNSDGGLVENRDTGLVDVGRRATRAGLRRWTSKIRQLGTTGLVSREIIAWNEDRGEHGMIRINPGINVGYDSAPGDLKLGLCRRDANFLRRWLI